MNKIIVFGFPHCGTSILKSIIGHINDVEEIYNECNSINHTTNKKYILCKSPYTKDIFFTDQYKDYIKIFIIRNPLWVFSSLNKRFSYTIPNNINIDNYINTIKKFIYYKKNNLQNLYLIRYEDMFNDNYKELKYIFSTIGFNYKDTIFNNTNYTNKIITDIDTIPIIKPNNIDHSHYRTYQINQPFVNNNDISKIDLSEEQKNQIINNEFIKEIYTTIELCII